MASRYSVQDKADALVSYWEVGRAEAAAAIGCSPETISTWVRQARGGAARTLMPCGTRASYNRGCRCEMCSGANREGTRRAIQSLWRRARAGELEIPHGTSIGYSYRGCRCPLCVACNSALCRPYSLAYHERQRTKKAAAS